MQKSIIDNHEILYRAVINLKLHWNSVADSPAVAAFIDTNGYSVSRDGQRVH